MNLQLVVSGLSMGVVYGMIAMGMVLIFRAVGIMNFAQGEFLMLGAYLSYTFNKMIGIPPIPSMIISAVLMAGVGIIFQRFVYWPLREAQVKAIVVSCMGASLAFREGAKILWGSFPRSTDKIQKGSIVLPNGASIQYQYIFIILIAIVLMIFVYYLLEKTFIGNIMQATAQDQYMASLSGIPVIKSISLTFAISALIAGVCGCLLAPIYFVTSNIGSTVGAKAFAAIVIGGFGSVQGAIIGGLIVGLIESFGGVYISSTYQLVIIYVVLILVLMVRPQGIFGQKIQEKV